MEKRILLGITGGIAAYKCPDLIRILLKKGIGVTVAMTKNAERFVTPLTIHSVSGVRVLTADWDGQDDPFDHLNAGRNLSAALIAPATANFLAKLAHGIADDLLSTVVVGLECPLYIAPAMNPRMYTNPAVRENLRILLERGVRIIPPEKGEMACGEMGEGRLPSVEDLAELMAKAVHGKQDLAGKKILVTAGPTEEAIDAVRVLTNRSSGKMGVAIARAARERGAEVVLVHGPMLVSAPDDTVNVAVRSAREMMGELKARFHDCDMLIMTAAVADFRPATVTGSKVKKSEVGLTLELEPNPDILEILGREKGFRIIVGFAAETENLISNAREKLARKNLDMVCANDVARSGIGFNSDHNQVVVLRRGEEPLELPVLPKNELAHRILDEASALLPTSRGTAAGLV